MPRKKKILSSKSNTRGDKSFKREILGLLLFAAAVFVAASLISHTSSDPSINTYTEKASGNWMGPVGAHLAGFLFLLFGYASWWIPAFFALTAWPLIYSDGSRPSTFPWLTAGSIAMLVATSVFLVLLKYDGGLLGISLGGFLSEWIGIWGTVLVGLVLFVTGLMAATPFSLEKCFLAVTSLFRKLPPHGKKTLSRRRPIREPSPQPVELENGGEAVVPRIAIPRKRMPDESEGRERTIKDDFRITRVTGEFALPPLSFLTDPPERTGEDDKETFIANAKALEQRLQDFGVAGNVVEICPGPVVTMYEFSPAPGVKINKVASLADDLALALKTHSVRIVAPIPGKAVIGIELANTNKQTVYLREILSSSVFKKNRGRLPLALGQDIVGEPVVTDLAAMPHLLIAGATGTGKSVGLNTFICSLLYRFHPDRLRLLMIDPKRIELSLYDGIPHLLHPVVSEPKEATRALRWAVIEMERRYQLLEEARARNLEGFNKGAEEPLPYLVVIIDELADLMMVSSKEVEAAIARLAQMARAAGIHLLVATQRPSVDVLTGLIKANFPARVSFKVSSKVDSRTIIDTIGAERLLGMGDMLFRPPGTSNLKRIHGAYVTESEIGQIVQFLKDQGEPDYDRSVVEPVPGEDEQAGLTGEGSDDTDEKYDEAVEIVTQAGQASISMLQRRLRVGYNRAARMIEHMEREGIVSPTDNMGRRQVLAKSYSD